MVPGQIAFTLILYFPSSIAKVFVIPITAHLLAAYGDLKGKPSTPAPDDIFIIEPLLFFFNKGIASLVK